MHFSTFFTLLPALAVALPKTPSIVRDVAKTIIARAPPEANAVLKSASASGTGCAANSASFVFGVGDGATVGFDNMIVDGTSVDKTKRCVITLDLQLDSKWKYTINKATNVRGYAEKEGGSYRVAYAVGGKSSEVSSAVPPGSAGGNYVVSSTSPGATSAYGGGVASIDVLLRLVSTAEADVVVTIDSLDVQFDYSK